MYTIEYIKKAHIDIPIIDFQRKNFFIHKKCSKAPITICQMIKNHL